MNRHGLDGAGQRREKLFQRRIVQPVNRALFGPLDNLLIFQKQRRSGQRGDAPSGDEPQDLVGRAPAASQSRNHNGGIDDSPDHTRKITDIPWDVYIGTDPCNSAILASGRSPGDCAMKSRNLQTNPAMARPQTVRKAVLPVAGMGTRFLPATKAVPKEMLPVVDKPVVQYAVEEAKEAGIEQFIFVTGRGKHVIEDHFDHAYELEMLLSSREKTAELNSLLEGLPGTGSVSFTRQQKPLGLGHAVWSARHFVGDEPFVVILPDDLMIGTPGALSQMMDAYRQVGGGVIVAAEERPLEETRRYGVVDPGAVKGNAVEVKGLVEKPDPANAPSRLCIIGRYILQPEIFAELDRQEQGAGGEIQLTDSMARLIGRMPFHAVTTDCARFDCGDKVGFLHANIAVGLMRPDIAPALRAILKSVKI